MKYILDSNVALKWVLSESDSLDALNLRSQYVTKMHVLLAPDVFPIECAHALMRAERKKLIAQGEGMNALFGILGTAPILSNSNLLLQRAVELSGQFRKGVYDCLYLALAEIENCELVTADAALYSLPNVRRLSNIP